MPIYVYELLDENGEGTGQIFEQMQSMKDKPLSKHPETGQPVQRVILPPNISTKTAISTLSNENLERLGFTKYERKGKGYMERVAGKQGPKEIHSD